MGSAELLENGLVKQEDVPQFVGVIRTEAARLVTLVEDIIHLSQLDEGIAPEKEQLVLPVISHSADFAMSPFQRGLNSKIDCMVTVYHKKFLSNAGAACTEDHPRSGITEPSCAFPSAS